MTPRPAHYEGTTDMGASTKWRWLALVLPLALLLAACTGSDDGDATAEDGSEGEEAVAAGGEGAVQGDGLLAEIKERGSLVVGMTLQFEPQMYVDEGGEPAGYDVELVTLLAEDLGVELDIRDQEFDSLIPGMLAGEFDLISVGLVNRPERAEQLWFSRPYVPYRQVVVVNDEAGIGSVEDLDSADVTMTALVGSTAANLITTNFPEATLTELEQAPAFLEVASGRAEAIVVEEYLALPFVEENEGTSILNPDEPFSQEYGRWAVPVGDIVWLQYVDNWLDYYTANGTLDGLYTDIIGPTQGLPQ